MNLWIYIRNVYVFYSAAVASPGCPEVLRGDPWCAYSPTRLIWIKKLKHSQAQLWKRRKFKQADARRSKQQQLQQIQASYMKLCKPQRWSAIRISYHPPTWRMHGLHARSGSCPHILNALPVLTSNRFCFKCIQTLTKPKLKSSICCIKGADVGLFVKSKS